MIARSMFRSPIRLVLAMACIVAATIGTVHAFPLAPEFRVNPQGMRGILYHQEADVSADVDGSFVVAWRTDQRIFVRRFSASGAPLTGALAVNSAPGNASMPSVGATIGGNFLVTWHSAETTGTDVSGTRINARHYDGAKKAFGETFVVNTTTAGDQLNPKVACNPYGQGLCAIVWERPPGARESVKSIGGRRYTGTGVAESPEFTVSSGGFAQRSDPDVAVSFANVMFTWRAGDEVRGRGFDYVGNTPLAEFAVNVFTTGVQSAPSIAAAPGGHIAIAWQSSEADGNGTGIRVRRFHDTTALGDEFTVNTDTTGTQIDPAIAMEATGAFVVTWRTLTTRVTGDPLIRAREFDASGTPRADEFGVDTGIPTSDSQPLRPAVAMDTDGDYVVVWDRTQASTSTSREIFGRRFSSRAIVDLALTLTDAPDPVLTNGVVTLKAAVSNLEPSPSNPPAGWEDGPAAGAASGVTVDFALGVLKFSHANNPGWVCRDVSTTRQSKVRCRLDAAILRAQQNAVSIAVLAPSAPIQVRPVASVDADQLDDALANNKDNEITTVQCPATTLAFAQPSYTVNEDAGTVTVGVVRGGGTCGAVSATLTFAGNNDLQASGATTLQWADGQTGSRFVTYNIVDDALDENDETTYIGLKDVVGATIGVNSTATIVITDNDPTPTVAWTVASQALVEAPVMVYFTARLSAVSGREVVIGLKRTGTAAQGEDTTEYPGSGLASIKIPAGQIEASGSVMLKGDTADEPDETIVVELFNPQGATKGGVTFHTINILDDDDGSPPPTIEFQTTASNVAEGGSANVLVTLSKASTATVTCKVAWNRTVTTADWVPLPPSPITVTIPAGQTSTIIRIVTKQDTVKDPDEYVSFTLGEPNNAVIGVNQKHKLTIVDDD